MLKQVTKLLEQNGLEYDWDKVLITDDGYGNFEVVQWDYDIPKPTIDEILAIDVSDVEAIEARIAQYPPMADYLDAQVKKSSDDPILVAEGEEQEAAYYAACLKVKEDNPK